MNAARGLLAVVLLVALAIVPAHAQPGPTQAELDAAAANATDWLHTNHDYGGQRFVDATGISRQNANALQPACRYEVGDLYPFHTNPIVYRGVMYLTTPSDTIALDAATCALRWRHHWEYKARANWPQRRGVAIKAGTIVRGTRDGYLLALDTDTGRLLWERVAGDAEKGETFTMPLVIFEDLVIIGPAGNEVPIKGWVGAFKLKDGDPVWRFNTVPRPGEPGAETWAGPTDVPTGGGAVWTPFSLDPAEGLVFVATGNPAPDFYIDVRRGANLYTSSLVVLDVRTGKLVWHHQATPHDLHDYLTQVSPLFRIEVDGKARRLVSVVGKEGLLRILDRESRAPVASVPVTSRLNVEIPVTVEGVYVCPGVLGGVQWNGPAFSPRTNMLYVPSVDWCGTFKKAESLVHVPGQNYLGGTWRPDPMDQGRGWLTAIDASTGAIRWRYESKRPMLAAVTVTSTDLVFTGELGGDFLVLDARDGTVLHRHATGSAMTGGIVTYQVAGKQYVAVTSGSSTRFWRTPPAPAVVTIFAVPAPLPREDASPPREEAVPSTGGHR